MQNHPATLRERWTSFVFGSWCRLKRPAFSQSTSRSPSVESAKASRHVSRESDRFVPCAEASSNVCQGQQQPRCYSAAFRVDIHSEGKRRSSEKRESHMAPLHLSAWFQHASSKWSWSIHLMPHSAARCPSESKTSYLCHYRQKLWPNLRARHSGHHKVPACIRISNSDSVGMC